VTKRRRGLTPEEQSLWARIARTINPLAGHAWPDEPEPPSAARKSPPASKPKSPPSPAAKIPKPKNPPPLAPLEPKLAKALKRGAAVDARLDLHGYRQDEAHARLIGFLKRQQARDARVVLVITGKGRDGADSFSGRGVLKRLVPAWLSEPSLRGIVLGFSEASAAHGGAGALYVRLRKAR
jgi:DNA-nicking Smr family endonuclease